jgi:hypothetical protein
MRSKFILTVAVGLLAGTVFAAAQQPSGAPSGEKDRTGQPADSGLTSTDPNRPAGEGQGTTGTGVVVVPKDPVVRGDTPLQPGGISPSAPPQGGASGEDAQPRPR